ncbi:MAG: DNA-protecting protein DprA, partial [Prevotella sp.]|nr:DNA-protecting protein DprA [Prevotella sp.]
GIALDYGREVMALPGNISSKTSEGCNRIIRSHKATLITSAQDVIDTMGWQSARVKDEQRTRGIQTQMFHDLTPEQQMIMEQLQQTDMQINTISRNTQIPIGKITAVLFEMEMKGLVKALAGGMYHLIK